MERIKKNLYFIAIGLIFILAFLLKIKTYLLARLLWHDEYALAVSILTRNIFGFFQPLEYDQKAPAGFMMLNKAVSYFGINVLCLKIVPFISGLFSVIIFYFLSKEVLKNKVSIVIANFLFAINYQLIYWAQKFKQYSLDVLLFMASILFFSKLDLDKISYKKCLLFSFISLLLILTSFPCVFAVGGFILYCILNKIKVKKILTYGLPLAISSFLYYFKVLRNVQTKEVSNFLSYWDMGFLKFNIGSFILVFKENFQFFFTPNNFVLIGLILFIFGLILLLKTRTKIVNIILLGFLGIIAVSILKIYPIWQRTALYLLPLLILFMVKPLDLVSKNKKIFSFIIIILFWACFSKYNFSYISGFFKPDIFITTDGLTTFDKLFERFNNKEDILVLNSTTEADFIYYSKTYNFHPKRIIYVPIYRYDKEYYYSVLNSLPKGHKYWFIFGWEYSHRKNDLKNCISYHLQTYIKEEHLKVLEKYEDDNSILIKIIE